MPRTVAPLTVTLADVCFLHWPVARETVADAVPDWLAVDVADDTAWVTAVALSMDRWKAMGVDVREGVEAVNCRTYVRTPNDERAVYFLSVDATDRLAVETARRVFRLPYHHADVRRTSAGDGTRVEATRRGSEDSGLVVAYDPRGSPDETAPDTLASFLTERYRYATEGPLGTRLVGSVGHDPWRLQPADATVERATLLDAAGIDDVAGDPLVHVSPGAEFRVGLPRPAPPGRARI